jgi:hypothetical protein
MTAKEILEKLEQNHFKPCDCLSCRKGGRIDQALRALRKMILNEFRGCVSLNEAIIKVAELFIEE